MLARLYPLFSIVGFLVLWALAAWLVNDQLFPSPWQVVARLIDEIFVGDTSACAAGQGVIASMVCYMGRLFDDGLFYHLAVTLWRVAASFSIAMLVGAAIGLMMGRSQIANGLFDPWLVFFLNIPALVIIFLCYIWGGLTEFAAILAVVINKIPNVAVMLREGARSLSAELEEMATSFRYNRVQKYRHVLLPQLQPFLAGAGRSGLSLIWKIVLVVEFIGRSDGVGFQLHTYFQLFDVAAIFAYSVAFIAVMLLIEILIIQPWERYATRWRPVSH